MNINGTGNIENNQSTFDKVYDTLFPGAMDRYENRNNSLFDGINYWTFGLAETVNGTFNPKKPLSLQHWIDSAVTVSMLVPGMKFVNDEIGALVSRSIISKGSIEVEAEIAATSKLMGEAKYTTKIKWGINDIEARPFGKGFWGKRTPQKDLRVDNFELKINPNNESFYLPHPKGGYVQFENLTMDTVQDGKLIVKQKSFYHVEDMPKFAQNKVLQEAMRQIDSAKAAGYNVEWLVSEEKAVDQLTRLFKRENIDITVRHYPE